MPIVDKIQLFQTWISFVTLLVVVLATYFAYRIGTIQNSINKQALDIQNFVETFVMPQQVIIKDEKGGNKSLYWNLLIKNASSYPIYLNKFVLNGIVHSVGNSIVPVGMENWYAIPIPSDVQQKKELTLSLEFEDYIGNKYTSEHYGIFENVSWQIRSQKRVLVTK